MKTKGRRRSKNVADVRPMKKGDRLKASPKSLPVELPSLNRMITKLTIEAAKATPELGPKVKARRTRKPSR